MFHPIKVLAAMRCGTRLSNKRTGWSTPPLSTVRVTARCVNDLSTVPYNFVVTHYSSTWKAFFSSIQANHCSLFVRFRPVICPIAHVGPIQLFTLGAPTHRAPAPSPIVQPILQKGLPWYPTVEIMGLNRSVYTNLVFNNAPAVFIINGRR